MSPGIVGESDLSGALQSEYVFFDGERIARKDFPGKTVSYYFSDHLKTASVISDAIGSNIKSESDYYPWGGELQFANGDPNHYKFTGKERDAETGLDYFGARHYSNGLGRFITPDWAAKATAVPYADFADPQSLNLYTYVRNIPTSKVDADGHDLFADILYFATQKVGPALANVGNFLRDAATSLPPPHSLNNPFPAPPCSCTVPSSKNQNNDANKNQNNSKSDNQQEHGGQKQQTGAQDKILSKSEVKQLQKNTGQTAHEIKADIAGDKNVARYDLYKNANGEIVVKPKGGSGPGEPTGYTTDHLKPPPPPTPPPPPHEPLQ